jgi:hypothetical protein
MEKFLEDFNLDFFGAISPSQYVAWLLIALVESCFRYLN